jgi:predicted Rossmann fold flavoprotein
VVGAGAAGLMAAIFAGRRGGPVLLLERTRDGGRKILISGGGRCNVLPSRLSPSQYVTASSVNSMRKMLLSWPLAEQRHFFEEDLGIPLALEQASGKLFPQSNRARDVRDTLVDAATRAGVQLRFDTRVLDIRPEGGGWRVEVEGGQPISAAAVVLATGGLSVPATGSDGTGLRILERLGCVLHPTYPALTPLTGGGAAHAALAGVSMDVVIRAPLGRASFETQGGFLFTHRGWSGPAVLNVSHLAILSAAGAGPRQKILVQWSDQDAGAWDTVLQEGGRAQLGTVVRRALPARLAELILTEAAVDPQLPLSLLRREQRQRLAALLGAYELPWSGDEGYRKAEVTGGGLSLAEVDPRTMEVRRHPGLFVCGEALDAFGPIGGYNFAWAWATGRAAGAAAANSAGTDHPEA